MRVVLSASKRDRKHVKRDQEDDDKRCIREYKRGVIETSQRLIKASVLLQRPCQVCVRESGRVGVNTVIPKNANITCRQIIFITHCGVCVLTFVVRVCVCVCEREREREREESVRMGEREREKPVR